MDILELSMKDCKLYSPFTGELIYDAGKDLLNENAKSFVACWHFDSEDLNDYYSPRLVDDDLEFSLPGIYTNHDDILRSWEDYLINCSHQAVNEGEARNVDVQNFIWNYDKSSNLICFRLSSPAKPKHYIYIVLSLDGTINIL